MGFLNSLDITVSALSAQRLRMDVIAQNVAGANLTNNEDGEPYRRQVVIFAEKKDKTNISVKDFVRRKSQSLAAEGSGFSSVLQMTMSERKAGGMAGVEVTDIWQDDQTPFTPVYDPTHPNADENGYYYISNVDVEEEQFDALAASRSYEAQLTIFESRIALYEKALAIGQ